MRIFSVRLSPLLRSSLDSLPSPEGMSFRLKLRERALASFKSHSIQTGFMSPAGISKRHGNFAEGKVSCPHIP